MINEQEAIQIARDYFLTEENIYGCAETTFMTFKSIYGLSDPTESASAMVLNGGVAYSGGMCGAISGAAMAVGMLAEERISDHKQAKSTARRIIMRYMQAFDDKYQSVNCGDLIQLDISQEDQHHQFIESGIWRKVCMDQIEYAIKQLYNLQDETIWRQVVQEVNPAALD